MSRSWPRVASPCGFSNLITSAPIHARSCEHVGPACTWVMSRIRTPFSASILVSGTVLFLFSARIQARDAAAFDARSLVNDCVDQCGPTRSNGFFHRAAKLSRIRGVYADAAECLDDLVVAGAFHEYSRCYIWTASRIDIRAAVYAVVVEYNDA